MPSTISTATLRAAATLLDSDCQTNLESAVTTAQATAVLDAMAGRDQPCDAGTAADLARTLIGLYPAREVYDARAYVAGMTAVLMSHPADFARRVCDPARGLPSRLKWLPTLADVTGAIAAERARRERIMANARYVLARQEAREREAADRAAFEARRPCAADRARMAAEAVASLRAALVAEPVPATRHAPDAPDLPAGGNHGASWYPAGTHEEIKPASGLPGAGKRHPARTPAETAA